MCGRMCVCVCVCIRVLKQLLHQTLFSLKFLRPLRQFCNLDNVILYPIGPTRTMCNPPNYKPYRNRREPCVFVLSYFNNSCTFVCFIYRRCHQNPGVFVWLVYRRCQYRDYIGSTVEQLALLRSTFGIVTCRGSWTSRRNDHSSSTWSINFLYRLPTDRTPNSGMRRGRLNS